MISTLEMIADLFNSVVKDSFHYSALKKTDQYLVWAEESQSGDEYADDELQEQIISGSVDYFTKSEFDVTVNSIQKAMDKSDVSWELNSVQYEDDTGYIHYEWIWEVDCSNG